MDLVGNGPADDDFAGIARIGKRQKLSIHEIAGKCLLVEIAPDTFDDHAKHLFLRLDESRLVTEGLHMTNIGKLSRVAVQGNIDINGLFLHRIAQAEFGDEDIGTKTVDFVLDGALKTLHDEERNDGCRQADREGGDGNRINRRGQSRLVAGADSPGEEIGKVQDCRIFELGL